MSDEMRDWADEVIFPLVAGKPTDPATPWDIQAVLGTAFAVQDQVVTCWHCVRDAIEQGMEAGLAVKEPSDDTDRFVRVDFKKSLAGHDLAVGRIPWIPSIKLDLLPRPHEGMNVYSYGYPLTEKRRDEGSGLPIFKIGRRLLRGYIVRTTVLQVPSFREAVVSELDMPAPAGLSGAPLLRISENGLATSDVIGVVQGQAASDVGTEFAVVFCRAYEARLIEELLSQ